MNLKRILALTAASALIITAMAGCGTDTAESDVGSGVSSQVSTGGEFSYSDNLDENGFWEGITAMDYVEMPEYNPLVIPASEVEITDEALESEMSLRLESYSTAGQITDRAVEDGDTVNIDYVGSVDGVEFEGGSTGGAGTDVTIGVTSYIDDFLEQLIGHMPGETFDINVTFPEDYGQDHLNGKDAVFVTTINYIVEDITPELTDEFIKENLSQEHGWTTVAEMEAFVREDMEKSAKKSYINDFLTESVVVTSVPDMLIKYQESAMRKYYEGYAESYGIGFDEFLSSYVGVETMEEFMETNAEEIKDTAAFTLVIQAIAEDADIRVTDEDLLAYFEETMDTSDYSQFEADYGLPYLKQAVLRERVIEFIAENAVVQ